MASAREQGKVLCFCASAAAAHGEKVSRISSSVACEGGDDLPFGRRPGKVLYFCAAGEEGAVHEEKGSLRAEGATVKNTRREKKRELFLRTHRSSLSVAAGGGGSGDLPCADSPRSLISRLLLSSIRKRPTGRIRATEEKEMAAQAEELPPQPVDTPVDGSEIDAGKVYSSGKKTDELCLNLGMGFALSFFFTRSSSEINKMIELRKQMEILLEEIKLHRSSKILESRNNRNYNSSASVKFSFHEPETESKSARDFKNRRNDLNAEEELVESVAESSRDDSEEKTSHCGVSAKELSTRLNQLVQTRQQEGIVELESSFHCTDHECPDNGEVIADFDGGDGKVFAGVSAPELERKLHELFESRQKERIMALESALELTKLKLHEKEREACRWRYNASLISER